jgi:transcriptional regulator with XRE-family HTH domain
MSALTFTAGLRARLVKKLGVCPTCGHQRWNTLRALAKAVGVSPATLTRWLNQGKEPDARTINLTVAYLAKERAR